jgi:hypothetical protein
MAHAEIRVQDNAIDAIVVAAQQILTVLPSLYWLACWCPRKAYIWPLSMLAPTMNSRERAAGDICNAADHFSH